MADRSGPMTEYAGPHKTGSRGRLAGKQVRLRRETATILSPDVRHLPTRVKSAAPCSRARFVEYELC